jgi:hypothetical protein
MPETIVSPAEAAAHDVVVAEQLADINRLACDQAALPLVGTKQSIGR